MKQGLVKLFFDRSSPVRLIFLTLCMLGLAQARAFLPLCPEEALLYSRVRSAQDALWSEMGKRGETDPENDTDKTGFIGLEWSEITTTMGSLESKRNACDPLWAVQCLRWFDQFGLKAGDRIVVLSSASFPGMLYSVLAAGETRGLRIDLTVSLGSSTWGANRPEAPWPVLEAVLRERGFLATRSLFYTLGGGGENGGGMYEGGAEALIRSALESGIELFRSASLWEIIERKTALIDRDETRLVVNVGGALSNMGRANDAITLRNGPLFPKDAAAAGDGLIALSLSRGIPVLHLLNLRSLADRSGIDFATRRPSFAGRSIAASLAGAALFVFVLATHKRWSWDDTYSKS